MIDTHTEDGQAGDGGTAADSPDATRMGGALVQRGMVADQGSPQPFPHMDGNTCILLAPEMREQVTEELIRDTIGALPTQPQAISHLVGPFIQLSKVNDSVVDVKVTHGFRAHFANPRVGGGGAADTPVAVITEHVDGEEEAQGVPWTSAAAAAVAAGGAIASSTGIGVPSASKAYPMHWAPAELPVAAQAQQQQPQQRPRQRAVVDGALVPLPAAHDLALPTADLAAASALALQTSPSKARRLPPSSFRAAAAAGHPAHHHPHSQWELDPNAVLLGRRIAVGGFAEVFVGRYHGTVVAVKRLLLGDHRPLHHFAREVALLAALRHPNLLLFMGFCTQPDLVIVSEFMARGSLYQTMRAQPPLPQPREEQEENGAGGGAGNGIGGRGRQQLQPLDAKLTRNVAISVARGMAYLHTRSPPILHLDLKSPNILLDDRWRVKIADFGLSRVRSSTYVSSGAAAGTPQWMAPEVLRNEAVDFAADVFSYGVILWEMLTGCEPWSGLHPMQVVGAVGYGGHRLPKPATGEPFLAHLCAACMSPDPRARPSFERILDAFDQQYGAGLVRELVPEAASVGGGVPQLMGPPSAATAAAASQQQQQQQLEAMPPGSAAAAAVAAGGASSRSSSGAAVVAPPQRQGSGRRRLRSPDARESGGAPAAAAAAHEQARPLVAAKLHDGTKSPLSRRSPQPWEQPAAAGAQEQEAAVATAPGGSALNHHTMRLVQALTAGCGAILPHPGGCAGSAAADGPAVQDGQRHPSIGNGGSGLGTEASRDISMGGGRTQRWLAGIRRSLSSAAPAGLLRGRRAAAAAAVQPPLMNLMAVAPSADLALPPQPSLPLAAAASAPGDLENHLPSTMEQPEHPPVPLLAASGGAQGGEAAVVAAAAAAGAPPALSPFAMAAQQPFSHALDPLPPSPSAGGDTCADAAHDCGDAEMAEASGQALSSPPTTGQMEVEVAAEAQALNGQRSPPAVIVQQERQGRQGEKGPVGHQAAEGQAERGGQGPPLHVEQPPSPSLPSPGDGKKHFRTGRFKVTAVEHPPAVALAADGPGQMSGAPAARAATQAAAAAAWPPPVVAAPSPFAAAAAAVQREATAPPADQQHHHHVYLKGRFRVESLDIATTATTSGDATVSASNRPTSAFAMPAAVASAAAAMAAPPSGAYRSQPDLTAASAAGEQEAGQLAAQRNPSIASSIQTAPPTMDISAGAAAAAAASSDWVHAVSAGGGGIGGGTAASMLASSSVQVQQRHYHKGRFHVHEAMVVSPMLSPVSSANAATAPQEPMPLPAPPALALPPQPALTPQQSHETTPSATLPRTPPGPRHGPADGAAAALNGAAATPLRSPAGSSAASTPRTVTRQRGRFTIQEEAPPAAPLFAVCAGSLKPAKPAAQKLTTAQSNALTVAASLPGGPALNGGGLRSGSSSGPEASPLPMGGGTRSVLMSSSPSKQANAAVRRGLAASTENRMQSMVLTSPAKRGARAASDALPRLLSSELQDEDVMAVSPAPGGQLALSSDAGRSGSSAGGGNGSSGSGPDRAGSFNGSRLRSYNSVKRAGRFLVYEALPALPLQQQPDNGGDAGVIDGRANSSDDTKPLPAMGMDSKRDQDF